MRRIPVLVITLLLSISPAAYATWMAKGTTEPSSRFDDPQYMNLEPDRDPNPATKVLYFNGFTTTGSPAVTTALQQNVAVTGSAIQLPYAATYVIFGVWKDCNADSYIGMGETAWRYPAALLSSSAICPIDTTFPTHNDGNWIYEFHPLVWQNRSLTACCDPNIYVDNQAMVWMDLGAPADEFPLPDCQSAPPRFYNQTGAMLARADCEASYAGTATINSLAPEELRFDDKPVGEQGESDSLLNQRIPTGDDGDAALVSAFDCSEPSRTYVRVAHPWGTESNDVNRNTVPGVITWNFTSNDGTLLWLEANHHPRVPAVDAGGSFWGTVSEAQAGATDCDRLNGNAIGDGGGVFTGNVTVGQVAARHDCLVSCEAPSYARYRGRVTPTMTLGSESWPENYTKDPRTEIMNNYGHAAYGGSVRQYWLGGLTRDAVQFARAFVTRNGEPAPATLYTYYGHVSAQAVARYGFSVPPGGGIYGKEACEASAVDAKVRFVCDEAQWWTDLAGNPITHENNGGVAANRARCNSECDPRPVVGRAYTFRDMDCYDQAVAAQRSTGTTLQHALDTRPC